MGIIVPLGYFPPPVTPAGYAQCPSCGTLNPATNKYCNYCGKELVRLPYTPMRCPRCSALNRPGSRFCGNCGASLA